MIYDVPPPRRMDTYASLLGVYKHKHQPGDRLCYWTESKSKNGRCFQLSEVEIIRCGWDSLRRGKYEIKTIRRVAVSNGQVKTERWKLSRSTEPFAYALDRNHFDSSEWDIVLKQKINLSQMRKTHGNYRITQGLSDKNN